MQLAERMSRIGVESAFEVLVQGPCARNNKARASSIWKSASPISPRRRNVIEAGKQALDEGWTKYGATQGLPELRECYRQLHFAHAGYQGRPGARVRDAGRQARSCISSSSRWSKPGDEVIYPDPGFPIYESMIRFHGRRAGADSAGRKPRLFVRPRTRSARTLIGQNQAGDSEFAAESHRRYHSRRGHESARGHAARSRHHGAER